MSRGSVTTLHQFSAFLRAGVTKDGNFRSICLGTTFPVIGDGTRGSNSTGRLRWVASAHVAAAWLFPRYFPDAWIAEAGRFPPQYYIEVLAAEQPTDKKDQPLRWIRYDMAGALLHPSRDLAALHLNEAVEEQLLRDMESGVVNATPVTLRPAALERGDLATVVGYEAITGESEEVASPFSSAGHVSLRMVHSSGSGGAGGYGGSNGSSNNGGGNGSSNGSRSRDSYGGSDGDSNCESKGGSSGASNKGSIGNNGSAASGSWSRVLVQTDALLTPGLCGAPVLDEESRCCGMVEGTVPVSPPEAEVPDYVRAVEGHAACMESSALSEFLRSLEEGETTASLPQARVPAIPAAERTG